MFVIFKLLYFLFIFNDFFFFHFCCCHMCPHLQTGPQIRINPSKVFYIFFWSAFFSLLPLVIFFPFICLTNKIHLNNWKQYDTDDDNNINNYNNNNTDLSNIYSLQMNCIMNLSFVLFLEK